MLDCKNCRQGFKSGLSHFSIARSETLFSFLRRDYDKTYDTLAMNIFTSKS